MSREQLLALPDDRTLAYEHMGPSTSPVVLIFFSGTLSVGTASPERYYPALSSRSVHYITPTLPGYGNTSAPAKGVPYNVTIANDISALLKYFYPDEITQLELHISGGSFGTVAAQMLYGAPLNIFPQGRYIKKMCLMGALPPLAHTAPDGDFSYARYMTWKNYIIAGPPAKWVPFRLLQRLLKTVIKSKVKTQEGAERFIREFIFDKMRPEEKELFRKWKEENGYAEGQLERELAEMNRRSVAKTWKGLISTPSVLHSEWWCGKRLEDLDEEHTKTRKVLIVAGDKDDATPPQWAEYLVTKYANARLKMLSGGHIVTLFHMPEIWTEFFEM
jgi:pimeloyl-ACP methyl ester carboxylesterase